MNLLLLLPLGLAAFAALLLPLLLHLARRSEQQQVTFAALQWLRALPQPRRKHRLEEWLLLLLRLLLLAALAVLLAQPVLFGRPDRRGYVAVAPGVDVAAARARMPDGQDLRWHRLASGFPALDDNSQQGATPPTAAGINSLLRELDMQLPAGTPLTVLVPSVLDGMDAERPRLSRQVQWTVVPNAADAVPAVTASDATAVEQAPPPTPAAVHVRHDDAHTQALRYLRAAGTAWTSTDRARAGRAVAIANASPAPDIAHVMDIRTAQQPLPADATQLIWLVRGEVPQAIRHWVEQGGRVLLAADARWPATPTDAAVAWRDDNGALVRMFAAGRGQVMLLQQPLLPAAMPALLEGDFPHHLRALFAHAPALPARVQAADLPSLTGTPAWPEQPRPLDAWLAWLIGALFLFERWLASGKRMRQPA